MLGLVGTVNHCHHLSSSAVRHQAPAPRDPSLPPLDEWELPRTQLALGDRIGAGAFGTVLRATGQGVHPDLESNAE